jgi:hypothetical protein
MLYESQLYPTAIRPAYGLTKNAGTLLMQQIAKDVSPDVLQIVSFHPGLIYNAGWKKMGVKETDLPFDDCKTLIPAPIPPASSLIFCRTIVC